MQFGRLLIFVLAIIGGSLLQFWVLLVVLDVKGYPIQAKEVFGDGGLFFFASSLSVGSALNLFDKRPMIIGKQDFIVTFLICGGILFFVVAYYAAVLSGGGPATAKPFGDHLLIQFGCALAAVAYWFFTGLRTGMFVSEDKGNV